MFTGIVEEIGTVLEVSEGRMKVLAPFQSVTLGESIAVEGVCLTVSESSGKDLVFDLAEETSSRTTLQQLSSGSQVNLERSLKMGDRLGGHLVQGHVDGVGKITEVTDLEASRKVAVSVPPQIARYLIEKGSIAVDGISLTIAGVHPGGFWVAIIPETSKRTTLGSKKTGDLVNIEVDQVAKYIEKLVPAKGV